MRKVTIALLLTFAAALPWQAASPIFSPYASKLAPVTFANLPVVPSNNVRWCSDCTAGAPCTGGGTGAYAFRAGGVWNCTTGAATGSLIGTTGTDDNRILRSDGVIGSTVQPSSITLDDAGSLSGLNGISMTGGSITWTTPNTLMSSPAARQIDWSNGINRLRWSWSAWGATRQIDIPNSGLANAGLPLTRCTASASLDYGVVSANSCSDLTITCTGAVDGNRVTLGVPNALASTTGLQFTAFVSAADTITVRACNVTVLGSSDPAAANVSVAAFVN